jgi:hypothetical protein
MWPAAATTASQIAKHMEKLPGDEQQHNHADDAAAEYSKRN